MAKTDINLRETNWMIGFDRTQHRAQTVHHFSTEEELLSLISEVVSSKEGTFYLYPFGRGYGREMLALGVDGEWAFAHFMPHDPTDDRYPVYATTGQTKASEESFVGFNVGGTLTEIPVRFCITIESIYLICKNYFDNISLDPRFGWEINWP